MSSRQLQPGQVWVPTEDSIKPRTILGMITHRRGYEALLYTVPLSRGRTGKRDCTVESFWRWAKHYNAAVRP